MRMLYTYTRPQLRSLGTPLLLFALLSSGSGCNANPRTEVQAQIADLDNQRETVRQALSNQQSTFEAMNQRLRSQNAELDEYNARIQGYILDHKMAVAAIAAGVGGAETALSENNAYSEDVKEVGGIVALLAVAWAAEHMDEVSDVVKNLNYADAHVRTLNAGIQQTVSAMNHQQAEIQASQNNLAQLDQRGSVLQAHLAQM